MTIGYANELYQAIVDYGLARGAKIVEIASDAGFATIPFAENGCEIVATDAAERLPYDDQSFDAAFCAEGIHVVDRSKALGEMVRVLRPGGIVAVWWKQLMHDDAIGHVHEEIFRDLGIEAPAEGLVGGFREFYAAPLRDHALRVIPWRISTTIDELVADEAQNAGVRERLGERADDYAELLAAKLIARYGEGNAQVPLGYIHYLYLGKK